LRGGVAVRLVRIDSATIRPGARLEGRVLAEIRPPLTVDNFEGVDARRGPGGKTLIYVVSDDNYNPLQSTLLLMFELTE
ncbi:MAG: esterase-like activity of phytase family protein, partial [Proteobacteria bacterium]|nr:esterase-like activity of phytase family protein [Pseudomonadota bacterium]